MNYLRLLAVDPDSEARSGLNLNPETEIGLRVGLQGLDPD